MNTRKNLARLSVAVLAIALCLKLAAGIFTLAGSGVNIPASTYTNFPQLYQVGTFQLPVQNLYLTESGMTNTNSVVVTERITFDGTNFYTNVQTYYFPTTNAVSGQLWQLTNQALPVYVSISVSNNQFQTLTNFGAQLQY